MSSTSLANILGDGQAFTEVFTKPLVKAVQDEMRQHVAEVKAAIATVNTFNGRISNLEANQKKALIGWGVLASAAAGLVALGWQKFRAWLRL